MTKRRKKDYKTAVNLIKKIIEDPARAHKTFEGHRALKWDYEKLSYEYDLLLTAYERLKSELEVVLGEKAKLKMDKALDRVEKNALPS